MWGLAAIGMRHISREKAHKRVRWHKIWRRINSSAERYFCLGRTSKKKLAFKDWNFREPSPSNQMSV
jgi:hypothetical protein